MGTPPRQFYTGNASIRREHLLKAGGFDPRFRRAEDIELAFCFSDLDLLFHFDPAAKGWHYRCSLRAWLNISTSYGLPTSPCIATAAKQCCSVWPKSFTSAADCAIGWRGRALGRGGCCGW